MKPSGGTGTTVTRFQSHVGKKIELFRRVTSLTGAAM
jgi:hypothetical protein